MLVLIYELQGYGDAVDHKTHLPGLPHLSSLESIHSPMGMLCFKMTMLIRLHQCSYGKSSSWLIKKRYSKKATNLFVKRKRWFLKSKKSREFIYY